MNQHVQIDINWSLNCIIDENFQQQGNGNRLQQA